MDNVFEILIYIIIIVSFLSSIFKKREKPKQPPVRNSQPEEYTEPEVTVHQTQQKTEYDILKEIEDFFKVEGEQAPKEIPVPVQPERGKMTKIEEEHVKDEDWHTTTVSEHNADEWERKKEMVREKKSQVDSRIEKQAAVFEESLVKTKRHKNEIASSVISKLKHPTTLKEYIIFSEIIGKPKALRR
jgi:hypothetical protein